MFFTNFFTFSEWYHYLLLFLWLVMLAIGIKYFHLFESHFKTKNNFTKGVSYGKNLLSVSFVIGFIMFLTWMFKPAHIDTKSSINWVYVEYGFYGLFIIMILINSIISIKNYILVSGFIRLITMMLIMVLYFYSGMLGGLMLIVILVMYIIIFALIKLKKTLTIR